MPKSDDRAKTSERGKLKPTAKNKKAKAISKKDEALLQKNDKNNKKDHIVVKSSKNYKTRNQYSLAKEEHLFEEEKNFQQQSMLGLEKSHENLEKSDEFGKQASLIEHFLELRQRTIYSLYCYGLVFLVCFLLKDYLLNFMLWPYRFAAMFSHFSEQGLRLQSTKVWETFLTKTRVASFAAICLSFPYIAYQFYSFIAPGLYQKERKSFLPLLFAAPLLFIVGAAFVYFLFAPLVLCFALSQQELPDHEIKIVFIAKISDYLHFLISFMTIFGIVFQLPMLFFVLTKRKLINAEKLRKKRKYAFLIALIFSAIITPPDILTMFAVAFPIAFLYEISVFVSYWVEKNNALSKLS